MTASATFPQVYLNTKAPTNRCTGACTGTFSGFSNFNSGDGTLTGMVHDWAATLTSMHGNHTLRYGAEWVQHTNSDAYIGGGDTYIFHTPDYWLHSVSMTYRSGKYEFGVGVRNLTDKSPPFISSGAYTRIGNAPLYSGYDFVGRTFFMNVVTRF